MSAEGNGGGFPRYWAARAAKRVAGARSEIAVVVSRQPLIAMRPRLYEAAPETPGVDLVPLLTAQAFASSRRLTVLRASGGQRNC